MIQAERKDNVYISQQGPHLEQLRYAESSSIKKSGEIWSAYRQQHDACVALESRFFSDLFTMYAFARVLFFLFVSALHVGKK